ncbi:hypothetical protein FRC08_001786 [Ceratobasidium sp. 394]|nr:hypothetical protein FRC08_001786 [Ceratobasidium sp. 394]
MSSDIKKQKGVRGSMRELGRNIRDVFWSPSPPPSSPASRSSSFSTKSHRIGRTRSSRSAASAQLSDPSYSPLEVVKHAGQAAWDGLGLALQTLEQSSDVCPPLKSATSGLLACLDILKVSAEGRRDYDELASRLTILIDGLQKHVSESKMLQMSDCVMNVVR